MVNRASDIILPDDDFSEETDPEDACTCIDSTVDPNSIADTEAIYDADDIAKLLAERLSVLTPRQKGIVEYVYGLADGQTHTFEEAGERFGITRERAYNIFRLSISRMRRGYHFRRSKLLREYLEY